MAIGNYVNLVQSDGSQIAAEAVVFKWNEVEFYIDADGVCHMRTVGEDGRVFTDEIMIDEMSFSEENWVAVLNCGV